MKKSEQQLKEEIKKMMRDSFHQNELYTAGNYWKFYEKNILKQVKKNSLSRFRSWKGGSGVGNIQSFGGGSEIVPRKTLEEIFIQLTMTLILSTTQY